MCKIGGLSLNANQLLTVASYLQPKHEHDNYLLMLLSGINKIKVNWQSGNQNSKGHFSPGRSGTTGITVETLHAKEVEPPNCHSLVSISLALKEQQKTGR